MSHRSNFILIVLALLLLVSCPGRGFADTGNGETVEAAKEAVSVTEEAVTVDILQAPAEETTAAEATKAAEETTAAEATKAAEETTATEATKAAEETTAAEATKAAEETGVTASQETADAEEPNILQDTPVVKPQPHYADPTYVETPAEQLIYSYVQTPYTYYKVRRWVGPWHRIEAAGQTFLNFGCGICCLTNMFDTILSRDITPDRMYEKCIEHSSYSPGGHVGAIEWKQVKAMCDYFGFTSELKKKPKEYAEFQKDAAENKTLMVLVCKDNDNRLWYYTRGHYVNLWEYDPATDTVFVTDASGLYNRERVPLSFVYAALKTASNYQYLAVAK